MAESTKATAAPTTQAQPVASTSAAAPASTTPPGPPAKKQPPVAGYYPEYLTWAATKSVTRTAVWATGFGTVSCILGAARAVPNTTPFKLGVDGARATAITMFAFYTVRDYGVNPLWNTLQYGTDTAKVPPPSTISHNLVSSGVAAGISSTLQFLVIDRFDPVRAETVRRTAERLAKAGQSVPHWGVRSLMAIPVGVLLQLVGNALSAAPASEETPIPDAKVVDVPDAQPQKAAEPASPTWTDKIKDALPVKKLSDEEYIGSLEARQTQLKQELRALNQAEAQWQRADAAKGVEQQQQQSDLAKAASAVGEKRQEDVGETAQPKKSSSWRSWIPGLSRL